MIASVVRHRPGGGEARRSWCQMGWLERSGAAATAAGFCGQLLGWSPGPAFLVEGGEQAGRETKWSLGRHAAVSEGGGGRVVGHPRRPPRRRGTYREAEQRHAGLEQHEPPGD